ncbi:MAG: D-hexose-6-phosphate mutarotase [Burkholderiaceae bacterium]
MSLSTVICQNLPCLRLTLPSQDTVLVALHGAQVLSWQTGDGRERLYLSPQAVMDGQAAIRGGVPVCFPQFNTRGLLPKHGFVRHSAWQPMGNPTDAAAQAQDTAQTQGAVQNLQLAFHHRIGSQPSIDALWPHPFELLLTVRLAPNSLHMALQVRNTGAHALPFTVALHTYLAVQQLAQVRLHGLDSLRYWDALTDTHPVHAGDWRYGGPFDAVFPAAPTPLVLHDQACALEITQSPNLANTVVWNPGPALSQQLADMPDDGYQHMLCVEAGQIDAPVLLAPGEQWLGWQHLRAL